MNKTAQRLLTVSAWALALLLSNIYMNIAEPELFDMVAHTAISVIFVFFLYLGLGSLIAKEINENEKGNL